MQLQRIRLAQPRRASCMPSRRQSWQLGNERAALKAKPTGDIESQDARHESTIQGKTANTLTKLQGPIVLTSVALLWGSYGPTLRLLYALPGPPHPAALTTVRGIIQANSRPPLMLFFTLSGL